MQGYNFKNYYALAVLTVAYVIGEISHYLIGTLTKDMAREIDYGDYACYLKVGVNTTFKSCDQFDDNST